MENNNFQQEVVLPSKGILNPEIPGGKIIQRCMMLSDQQFISGSKINEDEILQILVKRCIVSPKDLDVGLLTPADTLFLLFKLRVLSYGSNYRISRRCPECNERVEMTLDLSDLKVETLDKGYEKNLTVTLPHSGDTVTTKILTNNDSKELNDEIKKSKARSNGEDTMSLYLDLASKIKEVKLKNPKEGQDKVLTNHVDILKYVQELTNRDALIIDSTLDNISYGIVPVLNSKCPNCGNDVDVPVRLDSEFFRPRHV